MPPDRASRGAAWDTAGALAARSSQLTVAGLWHWCVRRFADRVAVIGPDAEITYAELDERSSRLARALAADGLVRGDRLAVLARTRPEYIETYLGAAKLGVTLVGLNIRMSPLELAHCLRLTQPRLLISDPGQSPVVEAVAGIGQALPPQRWSWPEHGRDTSSEYERRLSAVTADPLEDESDPEDIHCVLFTSGTTGLPKGAMISERASVTRAFRCASWFGLGADDGMVGWIPMFHTGGDECVKAALVSGGRFATLERADPETLFTAIERHRLTWTAMLPGVLTDFLHHPRRADYDLSSFRFAFGYANMMPSVVEEFTRTFGVGFWDAFGQTESSFVLALDLVRPGSPPSLRKQPTPLLDVRVVDQQLRELPPETPGECVVRGPSVMSGYVDDPAATAEVFAGGWLHTGDVVTAHADGTLTYIDRLKYLIKTGGENVYPAEVELALTAHPAVREASALGIPHERWGEAIVAVVVLDQGGSASTEELVAWCRERLAGYKCPREIRFIADEDVPRSGTGKIQRHELSKLFAGAPQTA